MNICKTLNITTRYANNLAGQGVRNWTKPSSFRGLKLANTLASDTIQLSKIPHLSEAFIKSLTKIKGKDKLEVATKIKDEILKKMGYKHPELLKLEVDSFVSNLQKKIGSFGQFSLSTLRIDFCKEFLEKSIEEQISFLYHELDHMDKFVKLHKAIGEEKFLELAKKVQQNSPIYKALSEKYCPVEMTINNELYEKMQEDIDIKNFDIKKWSKALENYGQFTPMLSDMYKYYNNPIEKSAYDLQTKINKILGLSLTTSRDEFPKNYISMVKALKKQGITDISKQDNTISQLHMVILIKNLNHKVFELFNKKINGGKITEKENEYVETFLLKLKDYINEKSLQEAYLETETYINKGILTLEDLFKHLCP